MKCLNDTEKALVDRILDSYENSLKQCKEANDIQEVGILLKKLFQREGGFICFGLNERHTHPALVFEPIQFDINDKKSLARICNNDELAYIEVIQGLNFIIKLYEAGLIVFKWHLAEDEELTGREVDTKPYRYMAIHDPQVEEFIYSHHYAAVIPTPELMDFKKRGYIDEESKRHKQSMRATWVGIGVAIFVGLCSIALNIVMLRIMLCNL